MVNLLESYYGNRTTEYSLRNDVFTFNKDSNKSKESHMFPFNEVLEKNKTSAAFNFQKTDFMKYCWRIKAKKIFKECHNRLLSQGERETLIEFLKEGCPKKVRGELWGVGSGGFCAMNANSGYYQRILKDFIRYPNPHFDQIEMVNEIQILGYRSHIF